MRSGKKIVTLPSTVLADTSSNRESNEPKEKNYLKNIGKSVFTHYCASNTMRIVGHFQAIERPIGRK